MFTIRMRFKTLLFASISCIYLLFSCESSPPEKSWPFELVNAENTGIHFTNTVENTEDFNIFLYRNFYNGAGVAIGDINNDGLSDVFFTSNTGSNKLYVNKGNFVFEDISVTAGVESKDKWSTGVVLIDINQDHLLDIYVCNAGYRANSNQRNELYINNGDLTFTERASEYRLDENGYTTHAAFFDYDKDGDLDVYVLNNSFMPVNTLNYSNKRELPASDWPVKDFLKGGGDKLLRNDNGKFTDVTTQAGLYSSLIGFGLGITVGDVNGDNWEDIYISNDFFERDYLYINQKDGSFTEEIKNYMNHISAFSMGADMADINNDSRPDIFVTDMLPDDEKRLKSTTTFEQYSVYELKQNRDFYHQYMQNTLQLNNGNNTFSEIAHYSGVSASDWSWGALIFDVDNDGHRDIYVCNGIYHDVTDQDFIDFFANDMVQKMALTGKKSEVNNIINKMPSTPIKNKLFMNQGDLKFTDISAHQNNQPSFSNGAAYGDLDHDGDLDLIINNVNQPAFIYKNTTSENTDNHYLKLKLIGKDPNTYAIGSKVFLYRSNEVLLAELIPSRGFQSSVDYHLIFGLGDSDKVDSLLIVWPDQSSSVVRTPAVDTLLLIEQATGRGSYQSKVNEMKAPLLKEVDAPFEAHQEDEFVDFYQEGLIIKMMSREGPGAAVGDVNGDGRDDLYICGAYRQAGQLYFQDEDGFKTSEQEAFFKGAFFEDTSSEFFDADGDGDLDLFVGSGGNQDYAGSVAMQDRVYLNDGKGNFTLYTSALPNNGYNTAVIVPFDLDNDNDLDLFVGSRSVPGNYGTAPRSYIYENDGKGKFKDVTQRVAVSLMNPGMITDAALSDVTGDGKHELIIVGEWMSPLIYRIAEGKLEVIKSKINNYSGWWYSITSEDIDSDGDMDLILGNRGENFYFTGTTENPAKLWIHDFDNNGTVEKIITRNVDGRDLTVHMKKELTQQVVSLKKQNLKHSEFADKTIQDLFTPEALEKAIVRKGNWFQSSIAVNDGTGNFTMVPLPQEVQYSSVNDIFSTDINGDGLKDLMIGGNDSGFLPQFSKLDASFGHVLINKGNMQFDVLESNESGFFVKGDLRQFAEVTVKGEQYVLCTINNSQPKFFKINERAKTDLQ